MTLVLLLLPVDILLYLLDYVGPLEIARFQMTCRTLRDVVNGSARLRYRMMLRAWKSSDNVKRHGVTLVRTLGPKSKSMGRSPVESYTYQMGLCMRLWSLQYLMAHMPYFPLPKSQRRFQKEIGLNLLALLCINGPTMAHTLHLRTISTQSIHPQASIPELVAQSSSDGSYLTDVILDIAGDHIGLLALDGADQRHVCIWNWRTGDAKNTMVDSKGTWMSFVFLREDAFLICNRMASGALDVYTLSSVSDSFCHTGSFHLPILAASFCLDDIYICRQESLLRRWPASYETTNTPLYSSDPNRSILALTLYYFGGTINTGSVFSTLVVDKAALLSDNFLRTSSSSSEQATIIPWDEWGDHNTRLFPISPTDPTASITSGVRFAGLERGQSISTPRLLVYDFSRYWPGMDGHAGITIVRAESVDKDEIFVQPVRTSLPYSMVATDPILTCHTIWMDEERIIGSGGHRDTSLSVLLVTAQ